MKNLKWFVILALLVPCLAYAATTTLSVHLIPSVTFVPPTTGVVAIGANPIGSLPIGK